MCWHIIRWNPKYYAWNDLFSDINLLRKGGILIKQWECRGSNCIKKGNGFFLVRQGEEPKGIMGSGLINSCLCSGCRGRFIVELGFETLTYPDKDVMLTRDYLKYMFPYVYWDTPKTGSSIDDEAAEILYKEFVRKTKTGVYQKENALIYEI